MRRKVLDLVEEALDEIALQVKKLAEADRVLAIGLGRYVRPGVAFGRGHAKSVQEVGALIGEQDSADGQVGPQFWRAGDVAFLARRQFQLDRTALPIDDRMDFRRKAASRTTGHIDLDHPFCRRAA